MSCLACGTFSRDGGGCKGLPFRNGIRLVEGASGMRGSSGGVFREETDPSSEGRR